MNLQLGEVVQFEARVTTYIKGYQGYRNDFDLPEIETDYKLSNPTKLQRIYNGGNNDLEKLPPNTN